MAASQKFQRLSRAPVSLGVRAASNSALARSEPANHRLSLLQRQPVGVGVLSNGVRVVTQRRPDLGTAAVGLFRKGGSEQETRASNGISGVFQRLQQQGTTKRSGAALASAVNAVQGHVHSVNERQYNGTILRTTKENIGEGINLLSDMALNPLITEETVAHEKQKSLQVLDAAEYDLETVVMDALHDIAFQGTSLALSPLGHTGALQSLNADVMHQFAKDATVGKNLCLIVCGDIEHDRVMESAEKQLGSVPAGSGIVNRDIRFTGSQVNMRDDYMSMVYTGVACEAPAFGNSDSMAMEAAGHIVGSYDRSYGADARHGLAMPAYHTDEHKDNLDMELYKMFGKHYSNTGLWGVYMISPTGYTHEWALEFVFKAVHRLVNRCRPSDVDRARCEMRAAVAAATETPAGHVEQMGRQIMTIDRVIPLHEMDQRIEDIKPEQVRNALKEYMYDTSPAYAIVGATDTPAEYHTVKQMMFNYWT